MEERTKLETEVRTLEKSLAEAESPKEGEKPEEATARQKDFDDKKNKLELARGAFE